MIWLGTNAIVTVRHAINSRLNRFTYICLAVEVRLSGQCYSTGFLVQAAFRHAYHASRANWLSHTRQLRRGRSLFPARAGPSALWLQLRHLASNYSSVRVDPCIFHKLAVLLQRNLCGAYCTCGSALPCSTLWRAVAKRASASADTAFVSGPNTAQRLACHTASGTCKTAPQRGARHRDRIPAALILCMRDATLHISLDGFALSKPDLW